jgi:RimJ/RimL family protein N-acetyltransferase
MEIRTDRLLLRELAEDDWAALLAYHRDPLYRRFYDRRHDTEEDARAFLRPFLEWQREEPRRMFNLAITLPATGELIGITGVRQRQSGQPRGDIGYELAPWHWGRGYATEAARAMLAFGFETLGLHKIEARCLAVNAASVRVLERLGMRLEARLREHEWIRGEPHDELLFGILAGEWANSR